MHDCINFAKKEEAPLSRWLAPPLAWWSDRSLYRVTGAPIRQDALGIMKLWVVW